ncbi:hypothetical protein [Chelativorans alearense]|uniref:hypothetical protein n=1 Tax=Chelativorans alearense TaxID=2681495 RepID=UPI001FE2B182|nr:hypothetical protein [Chelativorans alearense]
MHDLKPTANAAPAAETTKTDGRTGALLALIERITDAIEAETAAIRSDPKYDIKASNARKSRHLHELGKAFKGIVPEDLGVDHREAMLRLRGKLAANEATIEAHLGAVGEVAALLQKAIEQAQADGTYTVREFGR